MPAIVTSFAILIKLDMDFDVVGSERENKCFMSPAEPKRCHVIRTCRILNFNVLDVSMKCTDITVGSSRVVEFAEWLPSLKCESANGGRGGPLKFTPSIGKFCCGDDRGDSVDVRKRAR
jgi:hypothetical protein